MHVSELLERKGSEVVSIPCGTSLKEAARRLVEHRIGALIVSGATGAMAGILSERDVARRYALADAVDDCTVDEVMTRNVISCTAAHTLEELADMMSASNIRHVPVVSPQGGVEGMISIRDIVRYRLDELETENATLRNLVAVLN